MRSLGPVCLGVCLTSACAAQVPRVWDERALKDWSAPLAALGERPAHFTAEEYYRAPASNWRTYPVYHPDREPAGYWDSLRARKPEKLVDAARMRSQADWVKAGEIAFRELDTIEFRSFKPEHVAKLRDRRTWEDTKPLADGTDPYLRWVVTDKGIGIGELECAGCHSSFRKDRTVWLGTAFGPAEKGVVKWITELGDEIAGEGLDAYFGGPIGLGSWISFQTPWDPDPRTEKLRTMPTPDVLKLLESQVDGVFARFNGSLFAQTKIIDLHTLRYQRYIDATATHRLRGPEDLGRYAAFVNFADCMQFGKYSMLPPDRRRVPSRYADEVLYAIGVYLLTLEPPKNPDPAPASQVAAGQKVFQREGCPACHAPPNYTTGKLTLARGFKPPAGHPFQADIMPVSVGTDPELALKTRKGTGFYKIPSLRGLWYRQLLLHDGSVASLEEMFDPNRLHKDHIPGGWKGPGVEKRAIPGHEFGLRLPDTDKSALLAFLRSL